MADAPVTTAAPTTESAPAPAPVSAAPSQVTTVIPAPAATPASAPATTDWTTGFNEEMKGYVQTKGFKDPAAVLESYRNFEKLHGVPAERLLKLPENMDSPEARQIWEKIGRPKDSKDYIIDVPKDAAEPGDIEWLRAVADTGNYTQKQLDTLVKAIATRQEAEFKATDLKSAQEFQVQEGNLKREWGAAFEQNVNLAKSGANALGLSKADVDQLESVKGFEATMRLLHKLGTATGEHTFVSGNSVPSQGVLAPAQAKAKISELIRDVNFQARYKSGDADARRQWDLLNQQAAHRG